MASVIRLTAAVKIPAAPAPISMAADFALIARIEIVAVEVNIRTTAFRAVMATPNA